MSEAAHAGKRTPAPAVASGARLHVVTGKGGAGKTTVAAALGLALAMTGRRVLVVEVEGRQALAQLFDIPALPYQERRLVTIPAGGGPAGSLWGLAIDAERAMIEYLDLFYGLKRSGRGLKRMGAVDFVTTLAPGLRDVLLTGKVKEAAVRTGPNGRRAYDAVVLDAPPTGRIAKFLDAAGEVANLTKFGPIARQSAGVIEVLHSAQTTVHLVTLLEEMPVQETLDAAAELRRAGFQLGAVVIIRARPRLVEHGGTDVKLLGAGLKLAQLPAKLAKPLAAEVAEYSERLDVQDANAARLDTVALPTLTLPDLNPPVDRAVLTRLAHEFLQ